jgi:hypothetical protein
MLGVLWQTGRSPPNMVYYERALQSSGPCALPRRNLCRPLPVQVKRCYMKANLLVHPDKVKQKGGSLEQLVTADIAFDILKVAW